MSTPGASLSEVLGIEVTHEQLLQWRAWTMPVEQPFVVPRSVAHDLGLRDEPERVTFELKDTFLLYGVEDQAICWLDRAAARALPASLRRAQTTRHLWRSGDDASAITRDLERVVAYVVEGRREVAVVEALVDQHGGHGGDPGEHGEAPGDRVAEADATSRRAGARSGRRRRGVVEHRPPRGVLAHPGLPSSRRSDVAGSRSGRRRCRPGPSSAPLTSVGARRGAPAAGSRPARVRRCDRACSPGNRAPPAAAPCCRRR